MKAEDRLNATLDWVGHVIDDYKYGIIPMVVTAMVGVFMASIAILWTITLVAAHPIVLLPIALWGAYRVLKIRQVVVKEARLLIKAIKGGEAE